jgi:hypothetical protein
VEATQRLTEQDEMNELAFWFNIAEAGLGFALGVAMLVLSIRSARGRGPRIAAGIALVAFGLSDLVETQTGAWWRPWWLLAWKAACVLALSAFAFKWLREARGRRTRG